MTRSERTDEETNEVAPTDGTSTGVNGAGREEGRRSRPGRQLAGSCVLVCACVSV